MPERKPIRYFTQGQKKKFLKALKDSKRAWRDYFMFNLMLNTGLTLAETVSLNIRDILDGYSAKKVLEIDRERSWREITLREPIRDHIRKYIRQKMSRGEDTNYDAPLFLSRNHRRITKRAVQLNFDNWIKKSGIEGKFSPHTLRHTAGIELIRKTNNIWLVNEFLGHKSLSTTQIYTTI